MKKPHLPSPPKDGEEEQGGDGGQPEQQVQQKGQPLPAQAAANGPQQIVQQSQRRPQQKPLTQHLRLGQHINAHAQPSSRAKKPPRPAGWSSS